MPKRHRSANPAQRAIAEALEQRALLASTFPIAVLAAPGAPTWGTTFTFRVVYKSDVRVKTGTIDNNDILVVGPNGYSRPAKLVSITDNVKIVTARYKVSTPGSVWDAADNGVYLIKMRNLQVRDNLSRHVAAGKLGAFTVALPQFPSDVGTTSSGPRGGIDVTDFGARPNDDVDDTAAIQAAINSLPRSNGITHGEVPVGGTIWMPEGTYDVSSPLEIFSGIILRGSGANTILRSSSNDSSSSVIRIESNFPHGYVQKAAVEDLSIIANGTGGIYTPLSLGDVQNLRLSGLTISTKGPAIDLHRAGLYQSVFRNITVNNPGSLALWLEIGRSDANSPVNRVENFVVQGGARPGFSADALVTLGGDVQVNGLAIDDIGASVLPLKIDGTATIRNLALHAATSNLPGGVLALFDHARVGIDAIAGIASDRQIIVTHCHDVHIGTAAVDGGSTFARSVDVQDNASHITFEKVIAPGGVGNPNKLRVAVRQTTSSADVPVPVITPQHERGPNSSLFADVTRFRAFPDDNVDDTSGIQQAIDSLPRGRGLPGFSGSGTIGGVVYLPAGTFNISAPLRLPSGVWLQGVGSGTVIRSTASSVDSAVELVPGFISGYNVGAGISDLMIYTTQAAGVVASPSLTSGLFDFTLWDVQVGAGGVGVDLHQVKTFDSSIRDLIIRGPGSAGLWLGDDAGYSANNEVIGVQVSGENRPGYRAEKAQIIISGQTTVESVVMQTSNDVFVTPMVLSGVVTMRGMWMEFTPESLPDSVTISFENVTYASIDRFLLVDDAHRVRFRNAVNVNIGYFDISGRLQPLGLALDMDGASRVSIGTVASIYDAGSLDDPRLTIGGNYCRILDQYTDVALVRSAPNIAASVANWETFMGDELGTVNGLLSANYSQNSLRIDIYSNPNMRPVAVKIPLNVTGSAIGSLALACWRIDGPGQPLVWMKDFLTNLSGRVTNSMTASLIPVPLVVNDALVIIIPPIASGSYTISNVRCVVGS